MDIVVSGLDAALESRLQRRAAVNGRTVEAEACSILSETLRVAPDASLDLAEAIRRRLAPFGGIDLEAHPPVELGRAAIDE